MATQPDNEFSVCRKCGGNKLLDCFKVHLGWRLHTCNDCTNAARREKYKNRTHQYADRDTLEQKADRASAARKRKGRFVWTHEWLAERPTKCCTKCKIDLPANPAWFMIDSRNTTGLTSECRVCKNEYHWANVVRIRAAKRENYKTSCRVKTARCAQSGEKQIEKKHAHRF